MKSNKYSIILIIVLTVFSVSFQCTASRPVYSFSDDVFSELPSFPNDFYNIKSVYVSQKIMASQLGEDYFQPELLPTWDFFVEKIYGNDSRQMGSYGIFCYPSRILVSNVTAGDNFTVSTLIYSQWGIRFYQGLQACFNHSDNVNVSLIQPVDSNILLSPTFPVFKRGWMQILEININVLKTGEYLINFSECKPSDVYDLLWSETYGDEYVTGFGMLSMRTPRFQVRIIPPTPDEVKTGGLANGIYMSIVLFFMIVGYFVAKRIYARKKMEEE